MADDTTQSETNPTDSKTAPKEQRKAEAKAADKRAAQEGQLRGAKSPYAQ